MQRGGRGGRGVAPARGGAAAHGRGRGGPVPPPPDQAPHGQQPPVQPQIIIGADAFANFQNLLHPPTSWSKIVQELDTILNKSDRCKPPANFTDHGSTEAYIRSLQSALNLDKNFGFLLQTDPIIYGTQLGQQHIEPDQEQIVQRMFYSFLQKTFSTYQSSIPNIKHIFRH